MSASQFSLSDRELAGSGMCFSYENEGSAATVCPARCTATFLPRGPDFEPKPAQPKRLYAESNKNLLRIYFEVAAGKGCELLLAHDFGIDKDQAKALGKICKNVQAKKPVWDVLSAAVTTFGACKIAHKLVSDRTTLPMAVAIFVGVKSAEYFSHPRVLEALKPGETSETQQFLDYWAIRPAFKTAVTGLRYTEEKIIQLCYTNALIPVIASALSKLAIMSATSAENLGRGGSIGLSKVVSGIIAETIVSSARMHVDGDFSSEKLIKDVASGAALALVMGVFIPTSLVVITPKLIVIAFVTYTAGRIGVAILS